MLDKEIKRILKLKRIPGFNLSDEEKVVLAEWEASQKPVKVKKPRGTKKKKNSSSLEAIKTTNEVKPEDKTENEYTTKTEE